MRVVRVMSCAGARESTYECLELWMSNAASAARAAARRGRLHARSSRALPAAPSGRMPAGPPRGRQAPSPAGIPPPNGCGQVRGSGPAPSTAGSVPRGRGARGRASGPASCGHPGAASRIRARRARGPKCGISRRIRPRGAIDSVGDGRRPPAADLPPDPPARRDRRLPHQPLRLREPGPPAAC